MNRIFFGVWMLLVGATVLAAQPMMPLFKSVSPLEKGSLRRFEAGSHYLDQLPEFRLALEGYRTWRRTNSLRSIATQTAVGDSVQFKLYDFDASKQVTKYLVLRFSDPKINIWVESAQERLGNITPQLITSIKDAMLTSTPGVASKGILTIEHETFGTPPDSDGNGQLDVLFYDILDYKDDESGERTGTIAGFVSSQDLPGPRGNGNNRDILHLDAPLSNKGQAINDVIQTGAHEYQHLIHYNYDVLEETFVNEGLSEWAELLTGYHGRQMWYWLNFNDANLGNHIAETNVPLTKWRSSSGVLSEAILNLHDYQRAGLFTTYLAEQLGVLNAGSITRDAQTGTNGYTNAVTKSGSGLTLRDLILNWHTANYINDAQVEAKYGYENVYRKAANMIAPPDVATEYNGLAATSASISTPDMLPGGVLYYRFKTVKDPVLTADALVSAGETASGNRDVSRVRVILKPYGGGVRVQDMALPTTSQMIAGEYEWMVVLVTNVDARPSAATPNVKVDVTWSQDLSVTTSEVKYGDQAQLYQSGSSYILFSSGLKEQAAQATRFIKPANLLNIKEIALAPYYLNQFSSSGLPATAARDLKLTIWKSNGAGLPGDELFSKDVTDPRAYGPAYVQFDFFAIDMLPFADQLQNLPDTLYVGYQEAGTDANYMVIGVSGYETANTSFLKSKKATGEIVWGPLWNVTLTSGTSLSKTTLPIKVTYTLKKIVAIDDETPLPDQITLSPNYPNPFNPSTRLQYAIPQAGLVQLAVYDMLGRKVADLVNQHQATGQYEVQVDATRWSSGTYFCRLNANGQVRTQKMVLIK